MAKRPQKMRTKNTVLAAMFLAVGVVLPSLTGAIKEIGDSLLPMHLAVMLCGVVCGWSYATPVGLVLPFLRAAFFGMPPLYPNAVWMSLELATYGFVIGFLYGLRRTYSRVYLLICIYAALLTAMAAGRVVWGVTKAILLGVADKPFGFEAFLIGGFVDAIPGILLQFLLVPLIAELTARLAGKA